MGKKKPPQPRLDRWGTLNAFVDDSVADLTRRTGSASAGLVWFALFRLASATNGRVLGASERRLAKLTGLTRPTISAALTSLTKAKLLCVEGKVGQGKAPVYRLEHLTQETA
jgi:DNA-binding transcriptional ArsR family regulator